jgi:pre-mRNA-splicing helicase BRR2
MGTETYDGKERRYIDYPISDLLHMMGKASRQAIDSSGTCVILCCIHRRAKTAHLISSSSVGSI